MLLYYRFIQVSILTVITFSPGNSLIGFFIVLLDDSLLNGIFAGIVGVDAIDKIFGPGVVVSAFFRFTPDFN